MTIKSHYCIIFIILFISSNTVNVVKCAPNIIFIIVDDLGEIWDHFIYYN